MKTKFFCYFKFVKRPQTKIHADTMIDSKVIRLKNPNLLWDQICCSTVFFLVDILLKLQQQMLTRFCNFVEILT